jgi:hypothetical protein
MAEAAVPLLTEYECGSPVTAEGIGRATEHAVNKGVAFIPEIGEEACAVLLSVGLPMRGIGSAPGR